MMSRIFFKLRQSLVLYNAREASVFRREMHDHQISHSCLPSDFSRNLCGNMVSLDGPPDIFVEEIRLGIQGVRSSNEFCDLSNIFFLWRNVCYIRDLLSLRSPGDRSKIREWEYFPVNRQRCTWSSGTTNHPL